jgi:DNA-binding IscR family transcriptional regulator
MSACVESGKHDCCIEETCRVKPHMGAVNGAVRGALAAVSLASLTSPVRPELVEGRAAASDAFADGRASTGSARTGFVAEGIN